MMEQDCLQESWRSAQRWLISIECVSVCVSKKKSGRASELVNALADVEEDEIVVADCVGRSSGHGFLPCYQGYFFHYLI